MRPVRPHVFEQVISKPRLDSYKGYFHAKNVEEAIGLYVWNSELSTCFGALLSFFEIALRNNVHRAMSHFYSRGAASSDHWYDRIQNSLKRGTLTKIDEIRYEGPPHARRLRNPAPSPDEIVSRVSFGFWPGVLSAVDLRYAHTILPAIFPQHPLNASPSNWGNKKTLRSALAFIYELNDFRNRLAHHEPLWKFAAINDTSVNPPVVIVPASRGYSDSMARFQRLLGLLDGAMNALNPDFHTDMLQSSWRLKLNYLLSTRGFARYRALKHQPGSGALTPIAFRRDFALIAKANQPIRVKNAKARGVFIPD